MLDPCAAVLVCALLGAERDAGTDPLEAATAWPTSMEEFVERRERAQITQAPPASPTDTSVASGDGWYDLRQCESGNIYDLNTGNGYYGAYQFAIGTWEAMGGTGLPSDASPAEQDMRAAKLYESEGAAPWPVCGQHLGG